MHFQSLFEQQINQEKQNQKGTALFNQVNKKIR
jgi:hypothetical protein